MARSVTKKEPNYKSLLVRYLGLVWAETNQDHIEQATNYDRSPDRDLFTQEEL